MLLYERRASHFGYGLFAAIHTLSGRGIRTYKDQNDNFSKKYTNVSVSNRYLNREPRFYNTVFFNGRQWPVSCNQVLFYNGGNSGVQEGQATLTGYMLFKRFNRSVSLTNPG